MLAHALIAMAPAVIRDSARVSKDEQLSSASVVQSKDDDETRQSPKRARVAKDV